MRADAAPEVKMGEKDRKTLKELLDSGILYLTGKGIEEAATDAWLLLEEVFQISRSWYFAHSDTAAEEQKARRYESLLEQRGQRIPLQHLTGKTWFYGLPFTVNEHVLIPRQDTEILVEEALKRAKPGMKILDMCTGSGCILLSVLSNCPSATGTGADLSEKALETARKNAADLKIEAEFLHSDLFEQVEGSFDLILSNPPYIRTDVIPTLMPEVRDHEPWMALDGKEDGLYFYRRILEQAGAYLVPGGWLCFEIGYDQGEDLRALMRQQALEQIEIVKDLAGLDRVAVGRKK